MAPETWCIKGSGKMINLQKLADSYFVEREQNHVMFTKFSFEYYLKNIERYINGLRWVFLCVGYIIGALITMSVCHFIKG